MNVIVFHQVCLIDTSGVFLIFFFSNSHEKTVEYYVDSVHAQLMETVCKGWKKTSI